MTATTVEVRFEPDSPMIPRTVKDRAAYADSLRTRPGVWALLGTHGTAGSARQGAYEIRVAAGPRNAPFTPAGSFEAEARTMLGEYRVYVRYVGGAH